jgi:Skp family chaperone for outer membrane proteins
LITDKILVSPSGQCEELREVVFTILMNAIFSLNQNQAEEILTVDTGYYLRYYKKKKKPKKHYKSKIKKHYKILKLYSYYNNLRDDLKDAKSSNFEERITRGMSK